MIPSLLRRILYAIFLLWIISIITFWLSRQVPGDAVMDYISIDEGGIRTSIDPVSTRQSYERVARKRGLDLPGFYFSITPSYIPDPVYRILPLDDRKAVRSWIDLSKNGNASITLYHKLQTGLLSS